MAPLIHWHFTQKATIPPLNWQSYQKYKIKIF